MRSFPTLLCTTALVITGSLLHVAADSPDGAVRTAASSVAPAGKADPDDPSTWQTSDRVRGTVAPVVPRYLRKRVTREMRDRFEVAPGTWALSYDERSYRGPVRYHLIRMKWTRAGVHADYAHAPVVRGRQPLTDILDDTRGVVAGINGDFFDIGDSNAPLGLGVPRGGALRHGINNGWNSAFYIPQKGQPDVGYVNVAGRIKEFPRVPITNYNSPQVRPGGIGVYDAKWGNTAGFRWTDGQRRGVRMVRVLNGVVTNNRTTDFPSGFPVKGKYLIARGADAAKKLARLKRGSEVHVRAWAQGDPRVAITGNRILVKDGQIQTSDDGEMHPRTAVGIDRDKKQIIFLVADGRQSFSRGYTMLELARKMKQHGAEDALNLDGGGSSTLVARRNGELQVLNSPSDGELRPVPNGLQIVSR